MTDIMSFLKEINGRVKGVEKRLDSLDVFEKRVGSFEKEVTKIWNFVQDQAKGVGERVVLIEDKMESVDLNLGIAVERIQSLEKQQIVLKDELCYIQSQSMRNNLIFGNIPESPTGEIPENCEEIVKNFIREKLKIASNLVEKLSFERVHRMGQREAGRNQKIVAKFSLYKERELVRREWKVLDGTGYFIHEQFPKEVIEKRKMLVPKLIEAKKEGKLAWISFDTLYIDGKPQRKTRGDRK
ncbi:uncharacterized protein LOC128227051 [Mya arenaria]|uniref:uncharacterized protein LOC128227051 n=1 Tax=Mya arenaria TaxID=6604 RepID=UPI0022E8F1E1|nr:uncharacterized protein LOC128227051 [Mya arenaria]